MKKNQASGDGKKTTSRPYKKLISKTKTAPIPILDLCVWLYHSNAIPERSWESYLIQKFTAEFHIDTTELGLLFDPFTRGRTLELAAEPVTDAVLLNQIGWPEGTSERSGVALNRLSLVNVGPASELVYEPASRINLITGDNSLGKTFLLDCAWWAITGAWMTYAADPLANRKISRSEIAYTLSSGSRSRRQIRGAIQSVGT